MNLGYFRTKTSKTEIYISKKLHDWLLESFAINLYIYLGHLA